MDDMEEDPSKVSAEVSCPSSAPHPHPTPCPSFKDDGDGLRYLVGLRSTTTKQIDAEARKIAIDFPEIPDLAEKDNPAKWDIVFVCSDGVVFAHRLVIANASKYIMSMLDDQPPWYPTYVYVMDLPRYIVQLLVDLAYTGEMSFAEELQSDVIDAMQTLGWIHSDCLSAHYDGPGDTYIYGLDVTTSPGKDKKKSSPSPIRKGVNSPSKKQESKGSVLPSKRASFVDDEDAMEISRLPDLEVSDVDDDNMEKLVTDNKTKAKPKRGKKAEEKPVDKELKCKEQESTSTTAPARRSKRQQQEIPEQTTTKERSLNTTKSGVDSKKTAAKERVTRKPTSKAAAAPPELTAEVTEEEEPAKDQADVDEENEPNQSDSTVLDSPGKRQRRKPKRFEEYEELEKPKPRASPTKPSTSKAESSSTSPDKRRTNTNTIQDDMPVLSASVNSVEVSGKKLASKSTTKVSEEASRKVLTPYFTKKSSAEVDKRGGDAETESESDGEDNSLNGGMMSAVVAAGIAGFKSRLTKADSAELLKKRTFDEIRSSHIDLETCGIPLTNDVDNENGEGKKKPASRKSSRTSSKALSTDDDNSKPDDNDNPPALKKVRKTIPEDLSVEEVNDATPPRRNSSNSK